MTVSPPGDDELATADLRALLASVLSGVRTEGPTQTVPLAQTAPKRGSARRV